MHMSKAGIYDQLTSEYGDQFSAEAAQYAVDNMTADWNANALATAENYNETMHMSKAGLYDQLTSERRKFTAEEAQYAVDNINADWNETRSRPQKTTAIIWICRQKRSAISLLLNTVNSLPPRKPITLYRI